MDTLTRKDPSIAEVLNKQGGEEVPNPINKKEKDSFRIVEQGREPTTAPNKSADYWRGYGDALDAVIERLQETRVRYEK